MRSIYDRPMDPMGFAFINLDDGFPIFFKVGKWLEINKHPSIDKNWLKLAFVGLPQKNTTRISCWKFSPPKTNMEPKNRGLEDDFPFKKGDFQVPCWLLGEYSKKKVVESL